MTEIEAKFRLADPDIMRVVLRHAGADCRGVALETNTFFDWPDRRLLKAGTGLRVRRAEPLDEASRKPNGEPTTTRVTYKGPLEQSTLKVRKEVEFSADPPEHVMEVLAALGMHRTLLFEKRRETWHLGDCLVEIDELPMLGYFLEIEGPTESAVASAMKALALDESQIEQRTYTRMLDDHLDRGEHDKRVVRF